MAELYNFQKQTILEMAKPHKHIVISGTGSGKSAMALMCALASRKKKWLVVTTASARDSGQWYRELETWCNSQSSSILTVISWEGLAKWTVSNWDDVTDYYFIFDEIAKAKAGISTARGSAFLSIAKKTDDWAGFTATPGDRWEDFQAYFVAGGYVKNKTEFRSQFCQIQTFKGYPEVVGYRDEDTLRRWWARMTVCPDTSQMEAELPAERHYTHHFKPDPYYKKLEKTRTTRDGTFLDTTGAFCAACRRACFTKAKQTWLTDYFGTLGRPCVCFYALNETGDRLCELAERALPADARIWRVCGSRHDIPTAETIGPRDVVVCQWQAGSEALNLQFLSDWVSVEPCYSYSTSKQARGRIRRIGQKQHMAYHYLTCDHTIEEAIYSCLKNKGEFAEAEWVRKGE